jgi:hypothetical protein
MTQPPGPPRPRRKGGTISSIQFYSPTDGSWAPTNGSGFYFVIDADGGYEYGAVINSTVYNCSAQLRGVERGTAVLDGDAFVTHRHGRVTRMENTCGRSADSSLGPAVLTYHWSLDDSSGSERLSLTAPDGSATTYSQRALQRPHPDLSTTV